MSLRILCLFLTIGNVHARSVQYAIKNTMPMPTRQVILYFTTGKVFHTWREGLTDITYQTSLNQPINSSDLYVWEAEDTREYCNMGHCQKAPTYAHRIDVESEDGTIKAVNAELAPSLYDDMFWVVLPDGRVKRVYQIYYDGTIFPFLNDDPTTKKPDMNRAGKEYIPL